MHIYWLENISYTYTNIKYLIYMVQKHLVRPQAIAPSLHSANSPDVWMARQWKSRHHVFFRLQVDLSVRHLVNLICWPPWKSMPSKSPNGHTNNTNLTIKKNSFCLGSKWAMDSLFKKSKGGHFSGRKNSSDRLTNNNGSTFCMTSL